MNTDTSSKRSAKRTRVEIDAMVRQRIEHLRVLAAIAEVFPRDADVAGHATGTLGEVGLAAPAGVSRKAVARALKYWQRWRVLWLYWKGHRVWDVRFERAVVEAILLASANSPRDVVRMLMEHKRRREALAPTPVPKTLHPRALQSVESVE